MAYTYDWLSINPTTGTGNGTVTTTIESHSGYATRSKIVTVSATINNTSTSTSVKFNQAGTIISGVGSIKKDGSTNISETLTPTDLRSARYVQFEINNTNARDFQYFVEVVEGTIDPKAVTDILSAPSYTGTTITDVTDGTEVTLSTLTGSMIGSGGKLRFTYSMIPADLEKKFGENQTYSIKLKATPGNYTNSASQQLKVKYGLAVLTGATSITPYELKSFTVVFPPSTAFSASVTGGTDIGASGSTKSISITAPSDVTWNASVV